LKPNRTIASVAVLTLFFTPFGTVRAKNRRIKPEGHTALSRSQTIPLKIYRNFLPVAEVEIRGISETEHFVVDTGATPSVISVNLAQRLGLATSPSTFTAAGKVMPTQLAVVPEIDLGPIRAASLTVRVQDLSQLGRDLGLPIGGILGMDILSEASFRLDYDRSEIVLGESSRVGIAAPLNARAGVAMLDVIFRGTPARLLVDTGAERVVLFGGNFKERGRNGLRNTGETGWTLGDSKVAVLKFSPSDVRVGDQRFRTDAAYFIATSADPVFDGLLGVRALGFHRLSYDAISKTVYLQS
jgi:predicted aspartyl protease